MNRYLIILTLFLGKIYLAQTAVIQTDFKFPDEICKKPESIRLLFYNNTDSIKVNSEKCSDTIILNNILKGRYYVDIASGSFYSRKNEINIDNINIVKLEKSFIDDREKMIKEVLITKVIDPIVQTKGNKTIFGIANNDALNNGTLMETILKLPGVFNGLGGGLSVNGKITSIYIDGLPVNFSGQDLINYLNSISTANIQKIEIISNPGAMYDASSSSSVINIITNKKNKRGIGGILYGNTNFYIKPKFQSAIILNGLFNKFSWNFNANYSELNYENSNQINVFNQNRNETLNNYVFNDGIDRPVVVETSFSYPLTERTTTSFKYLLSNSNGSISSNSSLNLQTMSNAVNVEGLGNQDTKNNKNDILFKINHKFNKEKNSVSLVYNGLFFNKNFETRTMNSILGEESNNSYYNDFKLSSNKLIVDFEFVPKFVKINFGAKATINKINSNGTYLENSIFTKNINFHYHENANAIYLELNKDVNKFTFTGGLRYESVDFKSTVEDSFITERNINKFFPNFNVGYNMSSMVNFNLSYTKKIQFPGYQELDPNTSGLINEYLVDKGNPYLTPSISNNFEFRSNFLKMGYISFTYAKTDVDNFAIARYNEGTYVQVIEPFYNIKNWGASMGMPFPLGIITKGFAYSSTITDINNINYLYFYSGVNFPVYKNQPVTRSNKGLYYLGVNSNIILPFSTKLNLNYQYVSRGNYMIYSLDKSYYKVDLTLTKAVLDNNLKFSFSVQDIFNSANGVNGSFQNNNVDLYLKTYSDTQRVRLAITYLFGNNKINKPTIDISNDGRETKKSSLDIKP